MKSKFCTKKSATLEDIPVNNEFLQKMQVWAGRMITVTNNCRHTCGHCIKKD